MTRGIYLGLGSNLGDREDNLLNAIKKISKMKTTAVLKKSDIYETKPVGYLPQDKFLNMVIEIETCLKPYNLLSELLKIESELERKREIKWGPRTIDVDILLFDDLYEDSPKLRIPHERMYERAFVLVPLKEIYPSKTINGKKIEDLIEKCSDRDGVIFYKKIV